MRKFKTATVKGKMDQRRPKKRISCLSSVVYIQFNDAKRLVNYTVQEKTAVG